MKTKKLLTSREREILNLISLGISSNEMANQLGISIETIKTHRKNLILKVGARNVANLIRIAFEKNLLQNNNSYQSQTFDTSFQKENALAIVA